MVTYPLGASKKIACRPFYEIELLRLASADQYFSSLLKEVNCNCKVSNLVEPPRGAPLHARQG